MLTFRHSADLATDLACRLAMNGYQDLLHDYQPPDEASQR